MSVINNIVKIKKTDKLNSSYIENELKKLGYSNILRWAIVEVSQDFYKVNFCSF